MLHIERELEILQLINTHGTVSVKELADMFDVTEVTIRRDLQKLESRRLLQRTHGGAIRMDGISDTLLGSQNTKSSIDVSPDALILAPVQNRVTHTMRERALRSSIPLLAESAPFEGAIYLGPDNYRGAYALGEWTGDYLRGRGETQAHVLNLTSVLSNTQARSAGFIDGLQTRISDVKALTLNGQNLYGVAYQAALDALRVQRQINVLFGVNDDVILGAIQAALDLGRDPDSFTAVNVGGEGKTLFDVLNRRTTLKACLALFPEVVGWMGIDAVLRLWSGESISDAIITPSAVITADTLTDYYTPTKHGWMLNTEAVAHLEQTRWSSPLPQIRGKRVSFVIHYRTHEWYQNIAKAMQERADEVGVILTIEDVNDDLKAEITELRRMIGKMAARYVNEGDTIILDTGAATLNMAHFLDGYRDLTVITNSVAIFQYLQRNPNIKLFLTGGEFHRDSQSLTGRGAQLFLREIRADKVFMVAGGFSTTFGVSCKNQEEAEVRRIMMNAARELVVLADHTVIGADSHVLVAGLDKVNTLIIDAGLLSADRLDFNQRGIKVIVADEV